MNIYQHVRLAGLAVAVLGLSSCGGDDSAPPVSISFGTTPPSSLSVSSTASMSALVTNDTHNAGVGWSVSCAAAACGTFNPNGTASGATTTYTPPATLPSPATVTVTATAGADHSKLVTATINLTAAGAPLLADGTYVFHVNGNDGSGAYFLAGAFTVASGVITGGEQDYTDVVAGSHDPLLPQLCSLAAAGSSLQITLATANTNVGNGGIVVLRGTRVAQTRVLVAEFDPSATAAGSVDLQTSAVFPGGGFAFGLRGIDTGNGAHLVIGGILNFSGTALVPASSVFDLNDGGSQLLRALTFSSGTVSAADSYGRVSIDLVPASANLVPEFKLSAYVVGPGRLELIEDQSDDLNADLGGTALGQGNNAGNFTLAGVAGTTYVHGLDGANGNGLAKLAGTFVLNADGTVGGTLALNDGVNFTGNNITGSYLVDPTGRVSLNNIQLSALNLTMVFQLYLDGNGNGIVAGIDNVEVSEGLAYTQTATQPFGSSYAVNGQGILGSSGVWSAAGPVSIAAGSLTGSTDYNNNGTLVSATPLTGTQDSGNALFHLTGLDGDNFATATAWNYYPIDNSRALAIELDGQMLGLIMLEAVTP